MSSIKDVNRGTIQTVLGPISPDQLGPTLLHEHILCDIRPPSWKALEQIGAHVTLENRHAIDYGEVLAPGNYLLDSVELAITEVKRLQEVGGTAIVELSCGGLNPNPSGLKAVSQATGVHIVMGCGHYVEEYQPAANGARGVDDFAQEMIAQVRDGAWGTDIRAGLIGEIGCQAPWTPQEKRIMKGAAIAQQATGAALSVHPGRDADQPQEIADFLRNEGADLTRTIISHIDRTIFDDDRLFRLADMGVVIELDLFGMESSYYKLNEAIDMPNDASRLTVLRKLIDRGHLTQIAISQDICQRTRLSSLGGHGYGHIFRNILPMMRRRGFSDIEIDMIMVGTPRRLLTLG
ncbi:phosphotriesterase [Sphingorhabdus sp.]|uniref:phosphotriesterase n=1 Tax=Sphingorhabdus sp. TaxID=1902408 RepID=UPI0037C4F08A